MKIGFDNEKYLRMQSEHIRERINQFGNKLYLEFGGKLFDDYHASRVLPGFAPDSKLQMLLQLKDQAEIVIVISASDIEKNKVRGDLGITYDTDVLRLIDAFRSRELYVGSVVITQYSGQSAADAFRARLEKLGFPVYIHYSIAGYPANIPLIVSDEGYGKNDYIETKRPLVVITAPGPGSGKMATCLSQLYHEHKRGIPAGYSKFETFPIWNIPLKHPVNLAYEAATADLNDVNMIDPFHLEAYGVTTVNYNRDVEIFPVLSAIFEQIYGENPYKSPTDMGVNMAGNCIIDDEVCMLFAALTSSIALTESAVSTFEDELGWDRTRSTILIGCIMITLGSLSALGYGPLASVTVFGMQFLDFFDFLTNSVMMPIAAIATCLLVSRIVGVEKIEEEVTREGQPFRRKPVFNFMLRYLCPIFAAIILASSVANALGWIAM